ncbi:MAG: NAD(P)/FAD-dependent oxidoreductase [Candidatus Omnitrophica bacterium]|nr:NAD(P)/FAD-dependent oxidoreductase [Candidatus Omnitrophota bacterium]
MEQFDAVIIGAGPAGMMAAIRASQRNRKVLLIERNNTLGKKLLISGKGRCNLTNSCDMEDFLDKFSQSRKFLINTLNQFFNNDLISFFEKDYLKLKTERGGRVFPVTDSSEDILGVLKGKLRNKNIKILLGERVLNAIIKNNKIEGVLTDSGKHFLSTRIVVATGGMSYPETGSSGDGYSIARQAHHKIIPLRPALVPVLIKEKFIKEWQGISLRNVRLTLFSGFSGDKKIEEKFGEMIFTHFGVSGPVILDISADVYDALRLKNKVTLSINFKPALDYKKINDRLLREFKVNSKKSLKNIFKLLLPQAMITQFLEYCRIYPDRRGSQVTMEDRKRLIEGLVDLRLTVKGVMPVKDGIVTRGGVDTKEVNPKTMESKLLKGLFFAGEVLDIDAKTGGYNMQAAFSTGWVCGSNI